MYFYNTNFYILFTGVSIHINVSTVYIILSEDTHAPTFVHSPAEFGSQSIRIKYRTF
jgi:hypothetical protein